MSLPPDEVVPTKPGKPAIYSWTNIVNASALAFLVLALSIPEVRDLIPALVQPYVVAAIMVINLYLRNFVTSEPITSLLPEQEK